MKRPSRRTSIVLASVAFLVASALGIKAIVTFIESIDSTRLAAPGTTRIHLDEGRWMIFESEAFGFLGDRVALTAVTVRDDRETRIPLRAVTGRQTLTTDGDEYVGIVEFSAPREGDYEIEIEFAADVKLGRPITEILGSAALWGIAAFVVFLVFVLFLVLALIPVRSAGAPGIRHPVPPGWYPDPTPGTGLVRWWDGYRWTEFTQPRT